jgi:hypothetical protein
LPYIETTPAIAGVVVSRPSKRKPGEGRVFFCLLSVEMLFQLRFFVCDVLASLGIKFHDLHFFGHRLFVLGGRVKVTSTGGRFEFDFFSHDSAP